MARRTPLTQTMSVTYLPPSTPAASSGIPLAGLGGQAAVTRPLYEMLVDVPASPGLTLTLHAVWQASLVVWVVDTHDLLPVDCAKLAVPERVVVADVDVSVVAAHLVVLGVEVMVDERMKDGFGDLVGEIKLVWMGMCGKGWRGSWRERLRVGG